MNLNDIARYINVLSKFCGKRDLAKLTQTELQNKFQINKADIAILFGGSILYGGDIFAEIIKQNLAEKYMIVGGIGHTTQSLKKSLQKLYPAFNRFNIDKLSEAECFSFYLKEKYNLSVDFLETNSTNCGNNITFCLDMLSCHNIFPKSIIFTQDSSMQQRMDAGFRKYISNDVKLINYAAYDINVIALNNQLIYDKNNISGMWTIQKYISLLLGEISRLKNDINGYGPNGKNFIAEVNIPQDVLYAYNMLKNIYSDLTRKANDEFSKPHNNQK